jgi:CubicO group peptidase (beta-lactamase class C family)
MCGISKEGLMPTTFTRRALTLVLATAAVTLVAQHSDTRPPQYRPQGTAVELGLQGLAKVVCSAVYVSGRDIAEAKRNSGALLMPSQDAADKATYSIDREKKIVRMSLDSVTREAGFYGDQGCIIHRPGASPFIHFKPSPVKSSLPDAATVPWPMGDKPDTNPWPAELDRAKVDAAVEAAFADPAALTAGFIVLYKGRIVGERYMPGITKDTQLESWSMGKSIASTLFSLLVKDGTYTLEQAAPVPEWRSAGDPRGKIRNMDLLRMSSGLRFIATQDPDYTPDKGYPDHFYIYTGAVNGYDYSVNQPVQFPPNSQGRYRNSDPLTIMYLSKLAVTKRGEDFMTWPQRALFDRIGIRRQVLETDPYGNFLISGYDYGTPRNWARIGQLYLQDGMWQGTRILPEGWAKFVSTPAPAWSRPVYGGLFWVNGDGGWNLPRDAYFAAGAGGQNTFVVPSHQMVIVRMGHARGQGAGRRATNTALKLLMDAVKTESTAKGQNDARH